MNKNTFTAIKLDKGEMNVYDFEKIKIHAYKTNDFMSDEVFVIEKTAMRLLSNPPAFLTTTEYFPHI